MNTKVAGVMTTKPVAVAPDDELSDAGELLIGLVGIVIYVDVLKKFLDRLEES